MDGWAAYSLCANHSRLSSITLEWLLIWQERLTRRWLATLQPSLAKHCLALECNSSSIARVA